MDGVFLPLRGEGAGGGGGGGHLLTCSPSTTFFRLAQTSAREDLFCRQIFLPSAQLRGLVLPQLQGFAEVLKSCDALDIWKAICESVSRENKIYFALTSRDALHLCDLDLPDNFFLGAK